MIRNTSVPAAKLRRWAYAIACSTLTGAIPLMLLHAQQPATPPAQPAQSPSTAPAQPPAQPPANQVASQPADQPDSSQAPFRIGANEVSLIFTVTDKHGHYIPDLKQSDFALLDDQKSPAKVNSFHQQINLPLRVGIVIDASTSIRTRFEFEKQAATEFLIETVKPQSDRAFVMGFDVTPSITADWTNNLDALENGINRLSPGGGTALFDAVYTACRDKLMTEHGREPVRKAMILISDGDDNQSRVHPDEAIKMCERSETIIYAISDNWTPSRSKGDQVLNDMATATGGEALFPPSIEEMANSFHQIQAELRSQYALNYTPADFKYNGAFRPIYLYCYDRRYQVRAKKGYFAPTQ